MLVIINLRIFLVLASSLEDTVGRMLIRGTHVKESQNYP